MVRLRASEVPRLHADASYAYASAMHASRPVLCVCEREGERGQGQQLCASAIFWNSEQKSSESSCSRFRRKFVCKQCEVTAARHSLLDVRTYALAVLHAASVR